MLNHFLLGVIASAGAKEPSEVTYSINVVQESDPLPGASFTFRGGGQASATTVAVTLGEVHPTKFLRGYDISGIFITVSTPAKGAASYAFGVELTGPDASGMGSLLADVQGLSSPVELELVGQMSSTGAWRWGTYLPSDSLYNNWAPGTNRSVTLKWKD